MNWNVNELITLILKMVVVPGILYGLTVLKNYLYGRVRIEQIKGILEMAQNAVQKAVQETTQTYVDNIKGTDKWDDQAQLNAFNLAKEKAKVILSKDCWAILTQVVGDVNAYLQASIEAEVKKQKSLTE